MGLDIRVYRHLSKSSLQYDDSDNAYALGLWLPGASMEWSESTFPGRGAGIDPNTTYAYEDSYSFGAGSYGRYGRWRNGLAILAGYSSAKAAFLNPDYSKPFTELINFVDNEGVIGPQVSAKLSADFGRYMTDAETRASEVFPDDPAWWMEMYRQWHRAFSDAAGSGAVEFC